MNSELRGSRFSYNELGGRAWNYLLVHETEVVILARLAAADPVRTGFADYLLGFVPAEHYLKTDLRDF